MTSSHTKCINLARTRMTNPFLRNEHIEAILKEYPEYRRVGIYVFKSCQKEWIVVMERTDGTETNEKRLYVKDKRYAKYRASKLRVIAIINKFDPKNIIFDVVNSVYKNEKIVYKVGREVLPNFYDRDILKICAGGIHYYSTIEPAFYEEIDTIRDYNCKIVFWKYDGSFNYMTFKSNKN